MNSGVSFRSFPHSWLITGFVTRWTRLVSLVEQDLPTLPGHLSSPPGFSEVCFTWSFVLYVCFVDHFLSFCTFFFWPLCCLFFFYLRIMITPLVSSNSSYPVPAPIVTPVLFTLVKHYVISYKGGDEDVIVLPHIEHVGGHMWHLYAVTVNKQRKVCRY